MGVSTGWAGEAQSVLRLSAGGGGGPRQVASHSTMAARPLHTLQPHRPPVWAAGLAPLPALRFVLGMLPTPVHRWHLPQVEGLLELWVKVRAKFYVDGGW